MSKFDKLIPIILRNEGGYVNDPNDSGGETNYGISKRRYPHIDIKNLTKDKAIEIYKEDYWAEEFDDIEDDNAALHIFDMCVNAGQYRAVRMAQKVAHCYEDGLIGPATIKAINNSVGFVDHYKAARIRYYQALDKPRYIKGWINRVNNTKI